MKTSNEILDHLGEKIISECYDPGILYIDQLRHKDNAPFIIADEINFVKSLTEDQIDGLKKLIHRTQSNFLFAFFRIIEENEDKYKLTYEENGSTVNLANISESLKAEHLIENGWIDKFSKYPKNNI